MSDNWSKVRRVVSDVLGVDPSDVTDATSPDDVSTWDSLSHLNLVLALEAEFGVSFSDEEIPEMLSVKLIKLTLAEKGISDLD